MGINSAADYQEVSARAAANGVSLSEQIASDSAYNSGAVANTLTSFGDITASGGSGFGINSSKRTVKLYYTLSSPDTLIKKGSPAEQLALCTELGTAYLSDDSLKNLSMTIDWGDPQQPSDIILSIFEEAFKILDGCFGKISEETLIDKIMDKFNTGEGGGSSMASVCKMVSKLSLAVSFQTSGTTQLNRELATRIYSRAVPMFGAIPAPQIDDLFKGITLEFKYGCAGKFDAQAEVVDPIKAIQKSLMPQMNTTAGTGKLTNIQNLSMLNIMDLGNIFQGATGNGNDNVKPGVTTNDIGSLPKLLSDSQKESHWYNPWTWGDDSVAADAQDKLSGTFSKIYLLPDEIQKFAMEGMGTSFVKYYLQIGGWLTIGPFVVQKLKSGFNLKDLDSNGKPLSGSVTFEKVYNLFPSAMAFS